jgi:hypothetical protein
MTSSARLDELRRAIAADRTIDITTTGARTGTPRTIEIWYHYIDEKVYICGIPGEAHNPSKRRPRSWLANLCANPEFDFSLKESLQETLPARARELTDRTERAAVMLAPQTQWYREQGHELDDLIDNAPLVEVRFEFPLAR